VPNECFGGAMLPCWSVSVEYMLPGGRTAPGENVAKWSSFCVVTTRFLQLLLARELAAQRVCCVEVGSETIYRASSHLQFCQPQTISHHFFPQIVHLANLLRI